MAQEPFKIAEMSAKKGKNRSSSFLGNIDDVVSVVARFATSPSWLGYGQKTDHKTAEKLKPMILELRQLQENLSFSQKMMLAVMAKVFAKNKLKVVGSDASSWPVVTATRFRTLLRHVVQSFLKKTVWALDLLGKDANLTVAAGTAGKAGGEIVLKSAKKLKRKKAMKAKKAAREDLGGVAAPAAPAAATAATTAAPTSTAPAQNAEDFFYGFEDGENSRAWRVPASGGAKVYTKNFFKAPDSSQDTDPVMARFEDGVEHKISELTCKMLDIYISTGKFSGPKDASAGGRKRRRTRGKMATNAWKMLTFTADGSEVRLQVDKDRGLLWRIHHRGRACFQISESQSNHDESIAKEVTEMVAAKYITGEMVSEADLYRYRDELLLTKHGIEVKSSKARKVMQKPAATKASPKKKAIPQKAIKVFGKLRSLRKMAAKKTEKQDELQTENDATGAEHPKLGSAADVGSSATTVSFTKEEEAAFNEMVRLRAALLVVPPAAPWEL